jgi:hypothetical protein
MKSIAFLTLALLSLMSSSSFAQDHSHHAKHNMVLFGKPGGFYASHIVYKSPHNFQVILKINFDAASEMKLATEMTAYPKEQFIYLLDHMDISAIQKSPPISGQVFRRADDGSKQVILNSISLDPNEYSVVYFDELPLSLSSDSKVIFERLFSNVSPLQCAKDDERPGCCEATSSCRPSRGSEIFTVSVNATVEENYLDLLDREAANISAKKCGVQIAQRVSPVRTDYKPYGYYIRAWADYICRQRY